MKSGGRFCMKAVTASTFSGEPASARMPSLLGGERGLDAGAVRDLERALDADERGDRPLRDLPRLRERGLEQLGVGEAARREAHLDGARGVDPLGGEHQLGRALAADRGLERVAARDLGHEAEVRERAGACGRSRRRRRRRTRSRSCSRRRRRRPATAASSGLSKPSTAASQAWKALAKPSARAGRAPPAKLAEIHARREVPARAREQHDRHARILPRLLERAREPVPLRVVEGVLLLRAVQGHEQDALVVELGRMRGSSLMAGPPEEAQSYTAEMDPTLWYFAYGSNLDPGTFRGRRQMQPLATAIGRLPDFALCFDLPIGPGERGVANVMPRPGDHVWGALYQLTHVDAERLDRTEGVDKGVYRRLEVEVHLPDGGRVAAFTYRSEICRPERKPSRRYMGLLLAGARELALPAEWVERLRAWPLAVDERERQLPLL